MGEGQKAYKRHDNWLNLPGNSIKEMKCLADACVTRNNMERCHFCKNWLRKSYGRKMASRTDVIPFLSILKQPDVSRAILRQFICWETANKQAFSLLRNKQFLQEMVISWGFCCPRWGFKNPDMKFTKRNKSKPLENKKGVCSGIVHFEFNYKSTRSGLMLWLITMYL